MTPPGECDMTLAEGVGCTAMKIDGPRLTVAVDDTWRLQTRESGTEAGSVTPRPGLLAKGHGDWRMRQERRGGGGGDGWGSNAEAEMVRAVSYYFFRRS